MRVCVHVRMDRHAIMVNYLHSACRRECATDTDHVLLVCMNYLHIACQRECATDTDHVLLVGLNQFLHRHRQAELQATLSRIPTGPQHAASEQHAVVVL